MREQIFAYLLGNHIPGVKIEKKLWDEIIENKSRWKKGFALEFGHRCMDPDQIIIFLENKLLLEKRPKNKKKQAASFIYREVLLAIAFNKKSDSKEEMEGGGKKPSLSLPGLTVPAFILLHNLFYEALRSGNYASILPNY
jgi:hypothetical protein